MYRHIHGHFHPCIGLYVYKKINGDEDGVLVHVPKPMRRKSPSHNFAHVNGHGQNSHPILCESAHICLAIVAC